MLRLLTIAVLMWGGFLVKPVLAQTTPSVTITAAAANVDRGDDVKFKASLSSSPNHAVVILVRWAGYDRYWRLQPNFEFSFPCNFTNQGSHTITIQTSNDNTNEATYAAANNGNAGPSPWPTAYNIGSPNSATSTCN